MAKILTWDDMPNGVTKGSPLSRCPTLSMIESAIDNDYYLESYEPTNATNNQLLTSIGVMPSMTTTFTVTLNSTNTVSNLGGIQTSLVIKNGSTTLFSIATSNSPGSTTKVSNSDTFTTRKTMIGTYLVVISGYCFTGSVSSYRIVGYNGVTLNSGNFSSSSNSFNVNLSFNNAFGNHENSTSLVLSVYYS